MINEETGEVEKTIVKGFQLDEISAVDAPAQAGAKMVLLKRRAPMAKLKPKAGESKDAFVSRFMGDERMKAEYPEEDQRVAVAMSYWRKRGMKKKAVLTTSDEGHSHLVELSWDENSPERPHGTTSFAYTGKDKNGNAIGHSHPWVVTEKGKVVIGEADGHSHGVDAISKQNSPEGGSPADSLSTKGSEQAGKQDAAERGGNQENEMTPDKTALEKAAQEKLEALEKRAARAERVAELTDVQKVYLAKLDTNGQERFLALGKDARQAEVQADLAKAVETNPVVETIDGVEFRKNDDPRLLYLAKQAKQARDDLAKEKAKAQEADLAKRAAEFKHLPGDARAMLKAIDLLPEAERAGALACLKAQDAALAPSFETLGTRAAPQETKGLSKLETLTKSLREKQPGLSEAQAMAKVLATPEGVAAYREHVGL